MSFIVLDQEPPTITNFSPGTGEYGEIVTITGTHFIGPTVRFNGAIAQITESSTTELEVIVPVGASTGQITVTTAGGVATTVNNFVITGTGGGGGGGAGLSNINPQPLGIASPGTGELASREDHVHPMPSAADVGAALSSHTHTIANVTGLQTALDGKAATNHTHTIANVTGLQTALDGKAALNHTHTIANITGLQAALDDKVTLTELNDGLESKSVAVHYGIASIPAVANIFLKGAGVSVDLVNSDAIIKIGIPLVSAFDCNGIERYGLMLNDDHNVILQG